jgi:hypothetical protein
VHWGTFRLVTNFRGSGPSPDDRSVLAILSWRPYDWQTLQIGGPCKNRLLMPRPDHNNRFVQRMVPDPCASRSCLALTMKWSASTLGTVV